MEVKWAKTHIAWIFGPLLNGFSRRGFLIILETSKKGHWLFLRDRPAELLEMAISDTRSPDRQIGLFRLKWSKMAIFDHFGQNSVILVKFRGFWRVNGRDFGQKSPLPLRAHFLTKNQNQWFRLLVKKCTRKGNGDFLSQIWLIWLILGQKWIKFGSFFGILIKMIDTILTKWVIWPNWSIWKKRSCRAFSHGASKFEPWRQVEFWDLMGKSAT